MATLKRLLLAVAATICLTCGMVGCDSDTHLGGPEIAVASQSEVPVVNLPTTLRQKNWLGPWTPREKWKNGSCTHACSVMGFRWNGMFEYADWWARTHAGAESPNSLAEDLDRAGVRYAMTYAENDVEFLELAITTRRGCGVAIMGGEHMVFLCHLDDSWAGYIDPNAPDAVQWAPRQRFLSEWKYSDSWGVTPVYSPLPPLPF